MKMCKINNKLKGLSVYSMVCQLKNSCGINVSVVTVVENCKPPVLLFMVIGQLKASDAAFKHLGYILTQLGSFE